jgi:acetyl-CoA carboxylase biotin carboxylase subunit
VVPPFYDPLLAKVITHGQTRQRAVDAMAAALNTFEVAGIDTTIPLHLRILAHPDFGKAATTTNWLSQLLAEETADA